jgi:hypothetical protein
MKLTMGTTFSLEYSCDYFPKEFNCFRNFLHFSRPLIFLESNEGNWNIQAGNLSAFISLTSTDKCDFLEKAIFASLI